jgi:hypothetical protein
MLKRFALTALFAITFAAGVGVANARTSTTRAPVAPVPHGVCPWGVHC